MATFLFNDIIFGPVVSRRLGISLGVNLLPVDNKVCNFNCIYCECGWNERKAKTALSSVSVIIDALEKRLLQLSSDGQLPDVITFAGNGEPTMHPGFPEIIDQTLFLRNHFCSKAKVAVLTNATMLHSQPVLDALLKVDRAILKLDSAIEATRDKINLPAKHISLDTLLGQFSLFGPKLVIQTLFLKAASDGFEIDNTTDVELDALLEAYAKLSPSEIMIYCVDRDTPLKTVYKIPADRMDQIAEKIRVHGFKVSVSY